MATSDTLPINPQLLAWARQESGFELFRVAKRLNVKPEKVEAWEAGVRQPTMRQIQLLARFFHRPFSIFFLPKPPEVPQLATEYRRLLGVQPGHESPELRLALRQMIIRRETALNLFGELGEDVSPFASGGTPEGIACRCRCLPARGFVRYDESTIGMAGRMEGLEFMARSGREFRRVLSFSSAGCRSLKYAGCRYCVCRCRWLRSIARNSLRAPVYIRSCMR